MATGPPGEDSWLGEDPPTDAEDAFEKAISRAEDAIREGDAGALEHVLTMEPELRDNPYWTAYLLGQAAESGQAGAIAVLIDAGAPPDSIDENGGTPLMHAAWEGHLEAAFVLLAGGADPSHLAEDHCSRGDPSVVGLCALHFAEYKGHRDLVDLLEPITLPEVRALAREATRRRREDDARDEAENGPRLSEATVRLFMAIQCPQVERLREAIADGGDVNARLRPEATNRLLGSTPLSFAAGRGRPDLVDLLLEAGADPGLANHDGRVPADFAALNGHDEIAESLRPGCRGGGTREG